MGQGGDPKRLMQGWGRILKKVESMRTKNVKQKWKEEERSSLKRGRQGWNEEERALNQATAL